MREVNFSIPNANKASVGITTALYDRRALDCTSTLPLINSLNHLAYLTTSSARIRDILTIDGGVERLVCILKDGRSKDMMEMWKWNLAFQCVVNIGVRGSESVRTRVVEADMVPVIATILDNYIQVIDRCREKAAEADNKRSTRVGSSGRHGSRSGEMIGSSSRSERHRRPAPPPIDIPHPFPGGNGSDMNLAQALSLSSPPERTTFGRSHQHRSHDRGPASSTGNGRQHGGQNNSTGLTTLDTTRFPIAPVRDADRLPSMLSGFQTIDAPSQPDSPTTPLRSTSPRLSRRASRRPSIRHQTSGSGESDDASNENMPMPDENTAGPAEEPIVGIQNDIHMQDIVDPDDAMLDAGATPVAIPPPSEGTEAETFNITHRTALDGSLINPGATPTPAGMGFSPAQPTVNVVNATPTLQNNHLYPRFYQERSANPALAAMPRDEDVLMSLQLLAYVSKYCNLRSYFQKSHLVPRLKIGADIQLLDGEAPANITEEDPDDEYLLPDDFNIFPLVEKFTVRHHTSDMQYWAGVVMRNLCRKDDSRGGIRQCAYYRCGKWEEYPRQFAKCRRCRRTKYCSKECQKSAWVYHRHWCVPAQQQP